MLHTLTGDIRYLEYEDYMEEEGGRKMCELLDAAENRGIEKGREEGRKEGRETERREGLHALITTCKELGASFEVTAAKLKEKYSLKDAEVQSSMKLYW